MKHVGKQISTNDKLVILFREVPGEPDNCLVVKPRSLAETEHDSLMQVLEGLEGQQSGQLADVLHRHMNSAGRPILESLHQQRKIVKLPTTDVAFTPDARTAVALSEVNASIKANTIDAKHEQVLADTALNDQQLAESLVAQADRMEAEGKRLRKEAKAMQPKETKKKATTKKKASRTRATA